MWRPTVSGCPWLLRLTVEDPQPETAHLVEADVQRVAHRIVESDDSEFLERAPGAATPCSDHFHSLTIQPMGNDWRSSISLSALLASLRVLLGKLSIEFPLRVRVVRMVSAARLHVVWQKNWSLYASSSNFYSSDWYCSLDSRVDDWRVKQ